MLHLPTVICLSFILNVIIGIFFLSVYKYKDQSAFLLFSLACFSFATAEVLASIRIYIELHFVTHYLANIFIILSPLLITIGLIKYKNVQNTSLTPLYCILGFSAFFLLAIYPYDAAKMLTSLIISGLFFYSGYLIKSMIFVAKIHKKALTTCFLVHSGVMILQVAVLSIPVLSRNIVDITAPLQAILISHLILATLSALLLPFLLFSNTEYTLSNLANTDSLTQLFNRRGFFNKAKESLNHLSNKGKSVSIIILDIDFFKRVNDKYGHDTGDHAIKWIAQSIKEQFMNAGISARIGGEEFAILLPDYTLNAARESAEYLRENISKQPFYYQGTYINLSVSAGVSSTINGKMSIKDLLSLADKRLYLAKETGRDKVVTLDERQLLLQN
ncbi:GGDEF domain-containing protein [Pseudoalteromonas sp. MMG007]|nr:GGDEF domain-containing protein [Pseudoalteromonas sp. MMG007]